MKGVIRDYARDNRFLVASVFGKSILFRKRKKVEKPIRRDYSFLQTLPLCNNKILFRSAGNGYTCNPKYIAAELIRRHADLDIVWLVDHTILQHRYDFPPQIRLVMLGSDEALTESSTAHIIIDNTWRLYLTEKGIKKRPGQVYIQTWHGSYGILKYGLSRHNMGYGTWEKAFKDFSQADIFISNSTYESEFYRRTFHNPRILLLGHPRNDIFFLREKKHIKEKVLKTLNVPCEKKLLFYAPIITHSKEERYCKLGVQEICDAAREKFGGDWVMIYRFPAGKFPEQRERMVDASGYADIQELLAVSDIFVSNYSSALFDYLHSGRPAFVYAPDHFYVERERGLYYPLNHTPFSISDTTDELAQNIRTFDENAYRDASEHFLMQRGTCEDGHAAQRVAGLINEIIEKRTIR